MKKLTLVMLAVISMALVSCGGGNKHKTLAESVREREEKEKAPAIISGMHFLMKKIVFFH